MDWRNILTYYATQLSLPVVAGNFYYKAYIDLRGCGLLSTGIYTWQGSVHSEASVAKKAVFACK